MGKVLAYSTLDSQAVSDPSTKRAQRCLTWLIGREAVFSTWYGRKRNNLGMTRCSDNLIRAAQKVHYFWDLTQRWRIALSSSLLSPVSHSLYHSTLIPFK